LIPGDFSCFEYEGFFILNDLIITENDRIHQIYIISYRKFYVLINKNC